MKLNHLAILCAFLFTFSLNAQNTKLSKDFDISLSKPFKVVDAAQKNYQKCGNYIVSVKIQGKNNVIIQSFDQETLKLVAQKEYDNIDRKANINYFTTINDRLYLFFSEWDGDKEIEQLFKIEITPSKAEFVGKPERIIAVQGKLSGTLIATSQYFTAKVVDKFNFERSIDNKRLLIYYRNKPESRKSSETYSTVGVHVYNENIEETWTENLEMPYTDTRMSMSDFTIDKKGNLYVLATVYDEENGARKSSKKDETPKYHMELIMVSDQGRNIESEVIEVKDKFIKSVMLMELDNDHLVLGGYYSPKANYSVDGVFLYQLDKAGEVLEEFAHEIPLAILNQNESAKTAKKNNKKEAKGKGNGMPYLLLDRMVVSDDGSIVLIGEQYNSVTTTTTTSNGGSRTTTTYYYADILVTKFSTTGDLNWMVKVPKNQAGKLSKGGMGYRYMANGDNHYIVYLDNIKNLNLNKTKASERHVDGRGGFLMATKINHQDGTSTKEALFDVTNVKGTKAYQFSTGRIVKISDEEFVVEVYKKKKQDVWIRVQAK